MSLFNNFKVPNGVNYKPFLTNDDVIITAMEIASTSKGSRSPELKLENAMTGTALEFAVKQSLIDRGYDVRPAIKDDGTQDFTFDFFLVIDESWVKIDVKGMFASNSTTFRQSRWEHNHASASTIYLCFDCRTGIANFSGWTTYGSFTDSKFSDPITGTIDLVIYPNRLKK